MTEPRIACVDAGMAYHTRTLRAPPFGRYFGPLIDIRRIGEADLAAHPVLMIPCRTNGRRLAPFREQFAAYLDGGGFLVVLGETRPDLFLDGIAFHPEPTNYWWWLDPAADLGVRIADPHHPLFGAVSEADLTWHIHGTLEGDGARSLVDWRPDGRRHGSLMMEAFPGAGRLLITTLDPVYHHGSGFMPATTRFLNGFLPWLSREARDKP